jgi:hypothetical protein
MTWSRSRPPIRARWQVTGCGPSWRRRQRLGYAAYGSALEAWDEDTPGGSVSRYETVVTLMRKKLP